MDGEGRHRVLGLWSTDPLISVVGSVGLAATMGTALVVDMDASSPVSEARRSLADLIEDGPSLSELSPGRTGIAWLAGGGVGFSDGIDLIRRLSQRWPAVVVRLDRAVAELPSVPVMPIFPGRLAPRPVVPTAVWQPVGVGSEAPGPGPLLPRLAGRHVLSVLSGRLPPSKRWLAAWSPVWRMPWA